MKILDLLRCTLISLALSLMVGSALAEPGVAPRQILIGQSIALQGGRNDYGQSVQDGVSALIQEVNAQGGVHGRQIVLRTLDDDNQPAQAEAHARTLVEKEKVFVLFGSIEGGPSTAVMRVAVEHKIPFFGPMAGSPTLRRPHQPLVFPVRAEHREEFRALLGYAKNTGLTRVAFVRSDSETGREHLENIKLLCAELGMDLVADLPFASDITDTRIKAMVRQIDASHAQVVINHGNAGMYERLIRQARALGSRVNFSAVNSGSAQLAHHLGELAHGMVFSQVVPSPWERKTAITREYQEVFGRQKPGKDFSYGSLEGYVTAKALVAALRLAGPEPTRESFVRGLHAAGHIDLNGMSARYQPGDHAGLSLVDLSIVTREGKFRH